jgi:hypothetical protein
MWFRFSAFLFALTCVGSCQKELVEPSDSESNLKSVRFKGYETVYGKVSQSGDYLLYGYFTQGRGLYVYDSLGYKKFKRHFPLKYRYIESLNEIDGGYLISFGVLDENNAISSHTILELDEFGNDIDSFQIGEYTAVACFKGNQGEIYASGYLSVLGQFGYTFDHYVLKYTANDGLMSTPLPEYSSGSFQRTVASYYDKSFENLLVVGEYVLNSDFRTFLRYDKNLQLKAQSKYAIIDSSLYTKINVGGLDIIENEDGYTVLEPFRNWAQTKSYIKRLDFDFEGNLKFESFSDEGVEGIIQAKSGSLIAYGQNFNEVDSSALNNSFVSITDKYGAIINKKDIGSVNRRMSVISGGFVKGRFKLIVESEAESNSMKEYFFLNLNKNGDVVTY